MKLFITFELSKEWILLNDVFPILYRYIILTLMLDPLLGE